MTDGPRIRYWDNNYQEIPYCIQCGVPHDSTRECLRHNVSGVTDGKIDPSAGDVKPGTTNETHEERRNQK